MTTDKNTIFIITGLCSYLHSKGAFDQREFAVFLSEMLDDPRIGLTAAERADFQASFAALLPFRVVQ